MITTSLTILTSCLVLVHIVNGLPSAMHRKSASADSWTPPPPPPATVLKLQQQQLGQDHSIAMSSFPKERVVISTTWPSDPPKSLRSETSSRFGGATPNATRIHKRSLHNSAQTISSSSSSSSNGLVPACESVSRWVKLTEAEDLWENRVTVLQEFDNGRGSRVSQYFFETYCSRPGGSTTCTGTDTANYDSVCLEKYLYVYGKVSYPEEREERWTFVKIRASCNCALIRKNRRSSWSQF